MKSLKFKRNVEKYGLVTKWGKIKNQLKNNISSARDFKKFPPAGKNIFSIRIDKSNRVHLRNDGHRWTAIDIGPHTKMGHG